MRHIVYYVICFIHIVCIGCTNFGEPIFSSSKMMKICDLEFILEGDNTRNTEEEFQDSAILYIFFHGMDNSYGIGTFHADSNTWSIEYCGDLSDTKSSTCTVIYPLGGNHSIYSFMCDRVNINGNTSVKATNNAEWYFNGDKITIKAHLKNMMSRIRFQSDEPCDILVKGFQIFEGTISSNLFQYHHKEFSKYPCFPKKINVDCLDLDGKYYSEYFYSNYWFCGDEDHSGDSPILGYEHTPHPCPTGRYMYIYNHKDSDYCYRRSLDMSENGKSLVIAVPNPNNCEGWERIENVIRSISPITLTPTNTKYTITIGDIAGKSVNCSIKTSNTKINAQITHFREVLFVDDLIDTFSNYSGVDSNYEYTDYTLSFKILYNTSDKGIGDDDTVEFKNITISHFPYNKLVMRETLL